MTDLMITDNVAGEAVDIFLARRPLVVSLAGGATPRTFYERLARAAYPWEKVTLLLGDERCVPPDHPDSNRRMVEESLVSTLARRPQVLGPAGCDPEAYEDAIREALGELQRLDLAILGLGEDGHTASLFPGDPALDETERWVARVERPDHPRLTLTLPLLSSASTAMFLVTGKGKRTALRQLLNGDEVPAARVRSPEVLVIADAAAAP